MFIKRLLSVLLAVLILALSPASAENGQHETHTFGDYVYRILEDGTAEITEYTGSGYDIVIPDNLEGIRVTAVGDAVFFGNTELHSVSVPEGVTILGRQAFGMCKNLASVTMPESLTTLGDLAFENCSSLTSVKIPDNVNDIPSDSHPFGGCTSLKEIIVSPDHAYFELIDGVLFRRSDKKLICYPPADERQTYEIPEGTLVIGADSFYLCTGLTSVTVPGSVISIENGAFACCKNLISVSIPDGVKKIGGQAFFLCTSLKTVRIPDSAVEITPNPFHGCKSLDQLIISPDHPCLVLVDGVLFNTQDNTLISYLDCLAGSTYTVPAGTETIGDVAFANSRVTKITIPDSVTEIGPGAFQSCSHLTDIHLPDRITVIESGLFDGCRNLHSIIIPDSVTVIKDWAFANCTKLSSITLPNGLMEIEACAFTNCPGLKTITIPESVTSIDEQAFDLYTNASLKLIVAPGSYAQKYCEEYGINYTLTN